MLKVLIALVIVLILIAFDPFVKVNNNIPENIKTREQINKVESDAYKQMQNARQYQKQEQEQYNSNN